MELEDEIFKMMMTNNMNWVVRFHNHLNVSLKQVKKELPSWDEIKESDRSYWEHVYDNEFPKKLRQTTFLLMFGNLEEMLYLLWKKEKKTNIDLGNGNGVSKYKPFIKHCLGGDLGTSKEYLFILNSQEVRNSLLHIAGRISMMKDPQKLEAIIKSSKGLYSNKCDRIEISAEALLRLQQSINSLLEVMHLSVISRNSNA